MLIDTNKKKKQKQNNMFIIISLVKLQHTFFCNFHSISPESQFTVRLTVCNIKHRFYSCKTTKIEIGTCFLQVRQRYTITCMAYYGYSFKKQARVEDCISYVNVLEK